MNIQKTKTDTISIIPVEQYVESRLSKKLQRKPSTNGGEKIFGHDIYNFNGAEYFTIFSNERFETIPIECVNGIRGIKSVKYNHGNNSTAMVSSYAIIENDPKRIVVSSISIPFYHRTFTIKDASKVISDSQIKTKFKSVTSGKITTDERVIVPSFEEISFIDNGNSINFNFDAANNLATVWTKISDYNQMLESNIDPFKDSNNNTQKVMELLPIDYSILQLENVSRVINILRRYT